MPRPSGHEPQRDAVLMHPLAGEWPIATMDVDAAPTTLSVPKPMDMEDLRTQLRQSPSPAPTTEASHIPRLPAEYHISPPIPKPMDIQTSPSSPVIGQAVSDAAMEKVQVLPDIQQPMDIPPPSSRPIIQYFRKRRNDNRQVMFAGRDTHADALGAVTEKTRLVEQLDLTTRRIIENKDQKISDLQAQV